MHWLLLLLLLLPQLLRAADGPTGWSEPVKGLRARLFISPLKQGDDNHDHFVLFFQMERKDQVGNQLEISYTRSALALNVVDQDGKIIPWLSVGGNRMSAPWKPLILPRDATLSFPIGSSLWQGSGPYLGEYLAFADSFDEWMIPPHSTEVFLLKGRFTIPPTPPDSAPSPTGYIWSGAIDLPKITIPRIP